MNLHAELHRIINTADEEGMPGCETTREIRNLLDDYPSLAWVDFAAEQKPVDDEFGNEPF